MKISSKQAINIVESLSDIIHHNINFIDTNSVIIASSDKSRIGDYHGGSKLVYETKKPVVIYEDSEYEGAKAGINYPVTFEDEIVATIGITGDHKDVQRFSRIIVKMTEILIKEFYFRDQKEVRSENERYLIELLISEQKTLETAISVATSLNVDLDEYKRVAILKLQDKEHKFTNMRKLILNSIQRRLGVKELVVNNQGNYVLLLSSTDLVRLESIKSYITSKYSIEIAVGFSEELESKEDIFYQYQNTSHIVVLAHKMQRYEIVTLNDFDLELISLNLDESFKETYLKKVFGDISEDVLEQWTNMLVAFARNDGSINATSDELYIHKNTLQYRLKKIKEITGYDPRKLRDFTILFLATLLYNQE